MLEVQKFLIEQSKELSPEKVLEKLRADYAIESKVYNEEGCVILTYNMVECEKLKTKLHPYVMDCRGLILSYPDFKQVYCKPFTRFFNAGESLEYQEGFSFVDAVVQEKVDGSLLSFWYHPEMGWQMATRSCAFAEGTTSAGFSKTFRDAVLKALPKDIDLDELFKSQRGITWTFEFTSPETRVVKDYGKSYSLYFLSAHDNTTCKEIEKARDLFVGFVYAYNEKHQIDPFLCKWPRLYDLNSLEDIKECINTLEQMDEGFVVHHPKSGKRLKVKNPRYLEIAAIRFNGMLTQNAILHMVFDGELDEYLIYFEEDRPLCEAYLKPFEAMLDAITQEYESKCKSLPYESAMDRKLFAEAIKDSPYKHMFFRMKQGKSAVEAFSTFLWPSKRDMLLKYKEEIYDIQNGG